MAKTPKTSSEAVVESADAGTNEGALSAAAATEPAASSDSAPAAPEPELHPAPASAPAQDPLDHDGNGKKGDAKVLTEPAAPAMTHPTTGASVNTLLDAMPDPRDERIVELEADLAFLRKQFGWPKRT